MDSGLRVRLNPLGCNQLNVRELLRLQYPAASNHTDESSGKEDQPKTRRRCVVDDYDYDDDFIDDADVVEKQPFHPLLSDRYPLGKRYCEEDVPKHTSACGKISTPDHRGQEKPYQADGFGRFFVNRGAIPSLSELKPLPTPPTPVGNVEVEGNTLPPSSTLVGSGSTSSKPSRNLRNHSSTVKAKNSTHHLQRHCTTAPSLSAQLPKKNASLRKSPSPASPELNCSLPPSVTDEITKLATLCQTEFGEKNPDLRDSRIQQQLTVLFRAALSVKVARLFSGRTKNKRFIHVSDEMWTRLSCFIRANRPTFQSLGHALHWKSKENDAKRRVEHVEHAIDSILEKQRSTCMDVCTATDGAVQVGVSWTRALDEIMFEWYTAKVELQTASNQLAAKICSIKKAFPRWVSTLKHMIFSGFAVVDQELVESVRRIEREISVKKRQERKLERLERKRKRGCKATGPIKRKAGGSARAKGGDLRKQQLTIGNAYDNLD